LTYIQLYIYTDIQIINNKGVFKMDEYTKVTFRVLESEYQEYKKILIDKKTKPTFDLNEHIRKVIKENASSK